MYISLLLNLHAFHALDIKGGRCSLSISSLSNRLIDRSILAELVQIMDSRILILYITKRTLIKSIVHIYKSSEVSRLIHVENPSRYLSSRESRRGFSRAKETILQYSTVARYVPAKSNQLSLPYLYRILKNPY